MPTLLAGLSIAACALNRRTTVGKRLMVVGLCAVALEGALLFGALVMDSQGGAGPIPASFPLLIPVGLIMLFQLALTALATAPFFWGVAQRKGEIDEDFEPFGDSDE